MPTPQEPAAAVPRHVAVIMDGNGRWAQRRHLPRTAGHRAGIKAVRATVEHSVRRGVGALTLFAFSSENWRRPADEVDVLMKLFVEVLGREVDELAEKGVRLRFIGDRSALGTRSVEGMAAAEERTAGNERLLLNVAVSYGGRWDLLTAARRMAEKVRDGALDLDALDEAAFGRELQLGDCPDPDLFIRTGGEHRISNFLLWNLAYTELYFCDTLWPDFDAADYDAAIECFARRERRFGLTSGQVRGAR
ncbi:MAG: polyprenyl diphosphate synthase [Steroidobacteraceae bacterium]|jgi:undecaprenyl diphosphate synthase|nr:polyprenyl diphosphate synthase [Steroidobacteraceae bacterium]